MCRVHYTSAPQQQRPRDVNQLHLCDANTEDVKGCCADGRRIQKAFVKHQKLLQGIFFEHAVDLLSNVKVDT